MVEVATTVWLVAVELKLLGIRRFRGDLVNCSHRAGGCNGPAPPERLSEAMEMARLVRKVGRWAVRRFSCLHEAVTVWRLLARRGIPGNLRIGVRQHDGQVEAHAWVEYEGLVITGDPKAAGQSTPLLQIGENVACTSSKSTA